MLRGIILIHGAGLGGFVWDELKPKLNHPSLAVNFPNRLAENKINRHLSLEDYSETVIKQIESWNTQKLILVTHSIGACVGMKVAKHLGKRIVGFAAIASVIPANGNSFVSALPNPQKIFLPLLMRIFGTMPPKKTIENSLCQGLKPEHREMVLNNYTAESVSLFTDKCGAGVPHTKRLYIKSIYDKVVPIKLQCQMAGKLKAQKILNIKSGHLPMLTHPNELAEILNAFCKDTEAY